MRQNFEARGAGLSLTERCPAELWPVVVCIESGPAPAFTERKKTARSCQAATKAASWPDVTSQQVRVSGWSATGHLEGETRDQYLRLSALLWNLGHALSRPNAVGVDIGGHRATTLYQACSTVWPEWFGPVRLPRS
jgi:hypothetical protein